MPAPRNLAPSGLLKRRAVFVGDFQLRAVPGHIGVVDLALFYRFGREKLPV